MTSALDGGRRILIPAGAVGPLIGLRDEADVGAIAAQAGLRDAVTEAAGLRIGLGDYFRLIRWMAPRAGCETFGLSGRPVLMGGKALVYARAAVAPTLAEALAAVATTYNLLHGGAYNRVETGRRGLAYVVRDQGFPYTCADDERMHFVLESALISLHAAACAISGRDLTSSLRRVETRRAARSGPLAEGLDFWPRPVAFARPAYALVYDPHVAGLPVCDAYRRADDHAALVHDRILQLLDADTPASALPYADQVRHLFEQAIGDQAQVAQRLGLSVAGLRRRLAAEGATFRDLRRRHLAEAACRRLEGKGAVAPVAELLGFCDERAFRRAFKAWTGVTPAAYRDRSVAS